MAHLPSLPTPEFNLIPGENLSGGLRRLCLEQFESSLDHLSTGTDLGVTVHELRKSNKRVRALLRMVRPTIGDRVFKAENRILAEASRTVAPAREAVVMVDAITRLRGRYGHLLAPGIFGGVEDRLRARSQRISQRLLEDQELRAQFSKTLYRARSRYAAWPVEADEPRIGPKPIPNAYRSIGAGIAQTYAQGRKTQQVAYQRQRPEDFHAWRKQVKYVRHQMEIITPVWPEVIGGLATSLAQLGDVLGDDHDQAELVRMVAALPEIAPDPDERNLLVALSNQRRRELEAAARVMGTRIFAESADQFGSRLKAYWNAWSYGRN